MFSEVIDRVAHISGRPDSLADLVYGANEAMRTIQKKIDHPENSCEEEITVVDPNSPTTLWTPEVGMPFFRREAYVEYDGYCEPTLVQPSRRMRKLDKYYYRSGNQFVFVGAKSYIRVYYYVYKPWLKYSRAGERATIWNGLNYEDAAGNAVTDEAAIALVSNWMLERHNEVVAAGALSHLFAAKSDPRQGVHYSKFQQGIADIIRSEGQRELLGGRHG